MLPSTPFDKLRERAQARTLAELVEATNSAAGSIALLIAIESKSARKRPAREMYSRAGLDTARVSEPPLSAAPRANKA
jgi:hypothetical protein